MTRFYEQFAAGIEPAVALRDAQRWIRGVDAHGIGEFVSRHPVLGGREGAPRRLVGAKLASGWRAASRL